MAHDSIQNVNFAVCFCLVSTVDFLYMFYCITVCVMGLEPATEINWINWIECPYNNVTTYCQTLIVSTIAAQCSVSLLHSSVVAVSSSTVSYTLLAIRYVTLRVTVIINCPSVVLCRRLLQLPITDLLLVSQQHLMVLFASGRRSDRECVGQQVRMSYR